MEMHPYEVTLVRKRPSKVPAQLVAKQHYVSEARKRIAERPQLKLLPKETRCCEAATD